jgi:hypothetical protein
MIGGHCGVPTADSKGCEQRVFCVCMLIISWSLPSLTDSS